jgi:uncharacterized membrane protein
LGPGVAYGLNKHGDVVGYASNKKGDSEAVLWRLGKTPKFLGLLTADRTVTPRWSVAYAINDAGAITGYATYSWDPKVTIEYPNPPIYPQLLNYREDYWGYHSNYWDTHAFLWQSGSMSDLNDLSFGRSPSPSHPSEANKGSSAGWAINQAGVVVGQSDSNVVMGQTDWNWQVSSDLPQPVLFNRGAAPTDLAVGQDSSVFGEAKGINDNGAIVGSGAGDGRFAFFLSNGTLQLIDAGSEPNGFPRTANATGLNNLDHVIGNFGATGSPSLWVNNPELSPAERIIDLGALARAQGFDYSAARAINDHDQIVGSATSASTGNTEAVLWQNAEMIRLNERITSNPSLYLQSAVAVNKHGMIAANTRSGHAVLLIPAELMVDANRDGIMSFTNRAVHNKDTTTRETPYSFWVNDDQDAISGSNTSDEMIPPRDLDKWDNKIQSVRDCEDLTRLWLNLPGLIDLFKSGTLKVILKFKNIESGNPAIRIFRSVENGGRQYLTDEAWATVQLTAPFDQALPGTSGSTVASSISGIYLDRQFWEGLDETYPVISLLFEGVEEGKGELYFELLKDGQKIGEGPSVWLDVKNVKAMYERAKAQPESIASPYDLSQPFIGPVTYVSDPNGHDFRQPWDESKQCVVFVHGWNVSYDDYVSFSETMFKRLWHQGYKGHFAAFRWDTRKSDGMFDAGEYNRSENRAFVYGAALKSWVKSLSAPYRVSLVGHSMGNVVCGEALREGMRFRNYLLMEAAIPMSCYDGNAPTDTRLVDAEAGYPTPDYHTSPGSNEFSYGYRAYLTNVTGSLTNFFNPEDWGLATGFSYGLETNWERNQIDYKPDGAMYVLHNPFWSYNCDLSKPLAQRAWMAGTIWRYVADSWEMKAFVARSRTKAVGAVANNSGRFVENINLQLAPYAFGRERPDHSGQFTRNIQRLGPLYEKMRAKIEE